MVNYKCLRCGFSNKSRTLFIKHLNRKFICKPKLKDISRKEIYDFYFKKDEIKFETVEDPTCILDQMTDNLLPNDSISLHDSSILLPIAPKVKKKVKEKTVEKVVCNFCFSEFSRKSNRTRHYKICKEKIKYEEEKKKEEEHKEDLLKLVKLLNDKLDKQCKELNKQSKEMKTIKKELKKRDKQLIELQKKTGVTIGQQNNIQNNIKILAFNKTDMSHLKDKDYLKFLSHSNFCVPHMIKKLHFDPHKPENHNIYISNIKNNYVMIYDGKKWKLEDQKDVIEGMLDNNTFILEDKIEDWIKNGKRYPEIMEKFNRYIEKKENNEILNKIKQEIKLILFNNRKLILKDKN
jgi:hypothetical protein